MNSIVNNQMSHFCGLIKHLFGPQNPFFICVIANYFSPFFFDHPVDSQGTVMLFLSRLCCDLAFVAPKHPSPQAVLHTACFASLPAFTKSYYLCYKKCYVRTNGHPQLFKQITSLNFNYAQPYLDIQQFVSTIRERETERVWFGSLLKLNPVEAKTTGSNESDSFLPVAKRG